MHSLIAFSGGARSALLGFALAIQGAVPVDSLFVQELHNKNYTGAAVSDFDCPVITLGAGRGVVVIWHYFGNGPSPVTVSDTGAHKWQPLPTQETLWSHGAVLGGAVAFGGARGETAVHLKLPGGATYVACKVIEYRGITALQGATKSISTQALLTSPSFRTTGSALVVVAAIDHTENSSWSQATVDGLPAAMRVLDGGCVVADRAVPAPGGRAIVASAKDGGEIEPFANALIVAVFTVAPG